MSALNRRVRIRMKRSGVWQLLLVEAFLRERKKIKFGKDLKLRSLFNKLNIIQMTIGTVSHNTIYLGESVQLSPVEQREELQARIS